MINIVFDFTARRRAMRGALLRRASLATLVALACFAGVNNGQADVIGRGDILPAIDDGNGTLIPNLPQFGGVVGDTIVVGGTGDEVGGTDLGTLTIDIPQDTDPLDAEELIIGDLPQGSGLVTVVSLNSELNTDEVLVVARQGQGFLEVLAGAQVTSNVDESIADTEMDMIVGEFEGAQGFVLVDGFGSRLEQTNLSVGDRGHGRVEILDFARVETLNDAFIGRVRDSGSPVGGVGTVFVDGLGTRWNIGDGLNLGDGDLYVGNEGRGILEVRNEAWVRAVNDAFVGVEPESYGEVTVTGQGSLWWVVDEMFIGSDSEPDAQGQLYVNNQGVARADTGVTVAIGGRVDLDGGMVLTPLLSNSGVIRGDGRIETIDGFTNLMGGDLRNAAASANRRERLLVAGEVENFGIIESIGGEMEFEDLVTNNTGGQIFAVDAILRFRAGLVQNGAVFLEESIVESTSPIISTANMAVGAGSSFVLGDLILAATSELDMELGDLHSELQVTGSALLDGTLTLGLDDGFRPIVGDSFRILTADLGVSGAFATEVFPEISGISFDVVYNADNVVVNVTTGAIITGDFNGDGNVDGTDLGFWEQNFGTLAGATRAEGDANADGDVDGRDFLSWQRQKSGAPAAVIGAPVPEPTTLALLLLGGLLTRPVRKR